MRLYSLACIAAPRLPVLVNGVPETNLHYAGTSDAHGPRDGFYGDFSDAAASARVAPVQHVAVVVVVAGEDVGNLSSGRDMTGNGIG